VFWFFLLNPRNLVVVVIHHRSTYFIITKWFVMAHLLKWNLQLFLANLFANFFSNQTDVPQSSASSNDNIRIIEKEVQIGDDHKVRLLYAQIYRTFLVWAGDALSSSGLDGLSLALGTNATSILEPRQGLEGMNSEMAARLSSKYNGGAPVYVGYDYAPLTTNATLKLELDKAMIAFVRECLLQRQQPEESQEES